MAAGGGGDTPARGSGCAIDSYKSIAHVSIGSMNIMSMGPVPWSVEADARRRGADNNHLQYVISRILRVRT